MPPAAALFDNDGLTLNTEPAWTRAEIALFARHGATFTMEHKRELLGTSPATSAIKLERMLGRPGDELSAELYELVLEQVADGIEPMPGAQALLSALRAAGVALALVSNSRRRFVELGLAAAGLAGTFDTIVTAEDVPRPKPAPDAYLAAARELGVEIGNVRMVAAHAWDVQGALRAGAAAAFVERPGVLWNPLLERPDVVGKDLAEVAEQVIHLDSHTPTAPPGSAPLTR
jgi:2-haloacid dehalogenase